jgi:hypothetical protein
MVEYGVRDSAVMVGGEIGGKPLTDVTDVRRTISTQGVWFPFHAVVSTDAEWRPLRGWDRTHEYDAAFELVETIFAARTSTHPQAERLENGVYSLQYHPELARDPTTLRACVPGVTRFPDLMIEGNPDHLVERVVRIRRLAERDEKAARFLILAATPRKTGRVV